MKKVVTPILLTFTFIFLISVSAKCQDSLSTSVLWEINDQDLSSPSYLFGTFHLLNGNYLNKIEKWKAKFKNSRTVIVEMVLDSSKLMEVAASMVSPDTTLDKLLTEEEYKKASTYFKEVSGRELASYNSLKPISLSVLLATYTWAKLKPEDYLTSDLPMDLYFVKTAKDHAKPVLALESMEEQVAILYNGMTLKRQKELLMEMVNDINKTREDILKMDDCYRKEDLECLRNLIYNNNSYKEEELDEMLRKRNEKWMETILSNINAQSTFIAVGAGHLPGEDGLINLLRKEGYTVTPVTY